MQFRYLLFSLLPVHLIQDLIIYVKHKQIFMYKHEIVLFSVGAGGYGPPLSAGRGTPTQPPSPFNAFLVTTPAGSFAAPQGYPQQGYSTAPQFGQ